MLDKLEDLPVNVVQISEAHNGYSVSVEFLQDSTIRFREYVFQSASDMIKFLEGLHWRSA